MGILKFLSKCIGVIALVVLVIWDLIEFLALPAIFVVIGIFNQMPAAYYWITIGGYLALFALLQLLMWLLEKKLDKHFDALLTNKLAKRFSKE